MRGSNPRPHAARQIRATSPTCHEQSFLGQQVGKRVVLGHLVGPSHREPGSNPGHARRAQRKFLPKKRAAGQPGPPASGLPVHDMGCYHSSRTAKVSITSDGSDCKLPVGWRPFGGVILDHIIDMRDDIDMKSFIVTIRLNNPDGHSEHVMRAEGVSVEDVMIRFSATADGNNFMAVKCYRPSTLEGKPNREYGVVFPLSSVREVIYTEV